MHPHEITKKTFTKSAEAYASRKGAADKVSHEHMLRLSQVQKTDRVLDVATGPGYIAMLFAPEAREVIGIDLTPAFVNKARALAKEKNLHNLTFQEGDVEQLPFADATFNLVTCHKALHHFPNPVRALDEMNRVLRLGGRLVLGDTRSSDNLETARRHNALERLRDPSHVEMYGPKKLKALVDMSGFALENFVEFHDERDIDWWQQVMPAPEPIYHEVRERFIESIERNTLELHVRREGEKVYFRRRHVVLAAIKL